MNLNEIACTMVVEKLKTSPADVEIHSTQSGIWFNTCEETQESGVFIIPAGMYSESVFEVRRYSGRSKSSFLFSISFPSDDNTKFVNRIEIREKQTEIFIDGFKIVLRHAENWKSPDCKMTGYRNYSNEDYYRTVSHFVTWTVWSNSVKENDKIVNTKHKDAIKFYGISSDKWLTYS